MRRAAAAPLKARAARAHIEERKELRSDLVGLETRTQIRRVSHLRSHLYIIPTCRHFLISPLDNTVMSFGAVKVRAASAPKASTSLTLTRSRSTAATSPSFLEARARVKEHARNISRSSTHNAVVSHTVYISFSFCLSASLLKIFIVDRLPCLPSSTFPRKSMSRVRLQCPTGTLL